MTCRWKFQVGECTVACLMPVSALVAALLLAGCESRPNPTTYDAALQAVPPADTKPPQADVAILEPPKAVNRPAPHPAPHPAQPEAPVPELVGLDEQQLTDLLGAPTSQDGNGPGKHWYYRMRKCTLNLSLFPNVDTHVFRLLSYEVTDNDRHGDGQRCRSELANRLRQRQGQQARNG
ncbi:MAG TPA: hypothetical protein VNN98_00160 [Rhizomicrobium sp.]|nr:hypothetical protein [Rhizomicrobium sp.]